jgi:cell division protein FtsL|tara:strand:+ start:80 stop:385 length:306 start_codon:yes stop_codon:yes gene_type:complete
MKKFSLILLLITLIFFTAFIKNSTKRIDDQIFTVKENIRSFKKIFENIKLEFDYLSSAEKLLEFQDLYFEDKLINKDIQKIKIMDLTSKELKLMQFDLAND